MTRRDAQRLAAQALTAWSCCVIFSGCDGASSSSTKPVNWAEIESKTDPNLLVKKNAKGKGVQAVEREDRRRALLETKRKLEESQ